MSSHRDAVAMAKDLEAISDENIIHYFMPELKGIGEGQRATKILPDSVIKNFVRIGILSNVKGPGTHFLTEKAVNIIQESSE